MLFNLVVDDGIPAFWQVTWAQGCSFYYFPLSLVINSDQKRSARKKTTLFYPIRLRTWLTMDGKHAAPIQQANFCPPISHAVQYKGKTKRRQVIGKGVAGLIDEISFLIQVYSSFLLP